MKKILSSFWFAPLASGILTFIAMLQINFWLSWVCYIPLFISIRKASPKTAFKKGFLFGAALAFFAFFWMIPGAKRFTGNSIFYGLAVMIISLIFLSLYHACVIWCFTLVRKNETQQRSVITNAILVAAIICVSEALLTFIADGFPWFGEHAGSGLAANIYSIQPAAVFGVHILSFVAVLVNYLVAYCIANKLYRRLYMPLVVFIIYMLTGFLLYKNFIVPAAIKPFNVAILAENIPPEVSWNESNSNALAQSLVDLNTAAVSQKPNMMLWSESGIPWAYSKDDALIKEVLRVTNPIQATHIMGINTAYGKSEIFNSAYCILPGGQVAGRYDKQHLLALIERPINGLVIPFFSSSGYIEKMNVQYAAPLNTPYGKAGIMICNESSVPASAANMVKQGAEFLFNMSNDGWFNDTYIVDDHYFTARLRAVESRKDLVINSNNGYSGFIKASGEIIEMKRSTEPFTDIVSVEPNNYITSAAETPNLFVYVCACYVIIIIVTGMYKTYRIKRS